MMSNNKIFVGLNQINRSIYDYAIQHGMWIRYNKKWYTPLQFIETLGRYEINQVNVDFDDPEALLKKGRTAINNMILQDRPKKDIIAALWRLHEFTDKVRLDAPK